MGDLERDGDPQEQKSIKLKVMANELIETSKSIARSLESLGDNVEEIVKY